MKKATNVTIVEIGINLSCTCPHCTQSIEVDVDYRSKGGEEVVDCYMCQQEFLVEIP